MIKLSFLLIFTLLFSSCATVNVPQEQVQVKSTETKDQPISCDKLAFLGKDESIGELYFFFCLDDCYEGVFECEAPLGLFCHDRLDQFRTQLLNEYKECINKPIEAPVK
jgi:hypothetical protein